MATPKLRLSTAAIGPVNVNVGQNGGQQSVEAFNAGDGTLSLSTSSSVPWLAASIGTPRGCAFFTGSCLPVNIALTTSTLTRGLFTGTVTVTSPNTIDAPQTITVTVQAGSGIPDSLDMYVAPGASASTSFSSGSTLTTNVTNPGGGPTLSVVLSGGGSFSFNHSYRVTAQAPAGTTDGDYPGSIAVSGSSLAADNKSVPVTVHVTSQPIAAPSAQKIQFRIAQGAAKATQYIVLSNSGLGTLTVSSVGFGSGSPPAWLTTSTQANIVILTADATGLSPGVQTATASIASNARNGPVSVPIELDVLGSGPPVTYYQGVLDNATFSAGGSLAPGEIVALFGEQLTVGPPLQAASLPLGTSLGGATVTVNGQAAPIYYVSGNQIDFLIPYGAPSGAGLVSVSRDGQTGNTVSIAVAAMAPEVLPLGIGNYGNIVLGDLVTRPIPTTPGIASRPAQAGVDSLVIYALGMGQTTPPVADGVAAPAVEPLARVPTPQVIFGDGYFAGSGVIATPFFAGLTPGLVGLYQINVSVPAAAPRGATVPLVVSMGTAASNPVSIAISDPVQ